MFLISHLKFIYGLASFGKALLWNASSLLFIFFLTETVGLEPAVAGTIISGSLVLNAFADLVAGRVMTRYVYTAATAARAQFVGSVAAGISFVAFTYAGHVPQASRLLYCIATLTVFRIAYATYDVPHNTYFALKATSDKERFALASVRYIASGAATLFLTALTASWVRRTGLTQTGKSFEANIETDFFLISLALGVIAAGFSFLLHLAHATTKTAPAPVTANLIPDASAQHTQPGPISPTYIYILLAMVALSGTSPFFEKLEPYFSAYASVDAVSALSFMTAVAIGKLAFQPLWAWLAGRYAPERLYTGAAVSMIAACLIFLLLSRQSPALSLLSGILYGATWGGVASYKWGLLAKSVASDPAGATKWFGLFTFAAKLAHAGAVYGVGVVLQHIDYRDATTGGDAIATLMVLPPLAGALIIVALSLRLTRLSPGSGQVRTRCADDKQSAPLI
ncbi:MFS transporter [Asticcacaulis machinosus]|uniref:MFS transporter n=1 Tax=Asticcacaulis machinosus TaxID=2984211 RepID=A0ABT5HNI4_9CAUL|nr:MFS transporter [Asticcacaulis machinosus]MDC7677808.1 MFS transporter [Asticcacaulis machinosus]